MASGKYEGFSQSLLNKLFNATAWTIPTTLYLALYSVIPSVSTTGTQATGGGYARLALLCNTGNWPLISGSTTTITSGATFTMNAATADWSSGANQVAAGLLGSSGGTDLYYWGSLSENKPILNGDTPSFASGQITVQEL